MTFPLPASPSNPRAREQLQSILVSIMQNLTGGVLAVGRDGVVIVANPVACTLLGNPLEGIAGGTLADALAPVAHGGVLADALFAAEPTETSLVWRHGAADSEQWIELTAVPARGPWERHLAGLILLDDHTELRRLQRQATLRSRLAGMGELSIRLAHEIRNPLGSIALFATTLQSELRDRPALAELAAHIVSGVQSLDHLVANTLEFARPRRMSVSRVDLAAIAADALRFVAHPLAEKTIQVEFDVDPSAPAEVPGDGEQLRQVLLNLLINAIQATDDGGRLRLALAPARGGWRITVADDGHGIEPELLSRIFDPFFTTRAKGSGIGLAVCHAIVSAHGGRIEVDSAPGAGARFSVLLPERSTLLDAVEVA